MKNSTVEKKDVPLISVLLPVYNGELYLDEALESILTQTFTNFELIIIDDGSTDTSRNIIKKFKARDSRVIVVFRKNKGLAMTLNESMKIARGKWLARMDQDDIALPNRLERQINLLEQTGADVCGSWVRFFGSGGRRVWKCYQTDQAIKMDMLFRSPFAHPSVLLRTDIAKKFFYRQEFDKAEDYDLWVRLACAGIKMTNVQEVLLLYRIHPSQTSFVSLVEQRQLTAKIQRHYWKFVMKRLHSIYSGQDVISLTTMHGQPNMDIVELTLSELLEKTHGEALRAMMNNISWLYLRIAANTPDILSRWNRLNKKSGLGMDCGMIIKLFLLCFLKVRRGGFLFNAAKRVYYFIKS